MLAGLSSRRYHVGLEPIGAQVSAEATTSKSVISDHVCVVALGITIDGVKVPLAIEEGSTENATLVTSLIVGWRERGPYNVTKPILAVLDGSTALSRAVQDVFAP